MTNEEALSFLRSHQPMPPDHDLRPDLIQKYDEVREYFLKGRDVRCVPLFLNSFGEGSGFGVYQTVEEVIRTYPPSEVVPHLAVALASKHKGVRYWCAEIAALFPAPDLIRPLAALLNEDSSDTRFAAVTALEQIKHSSVTKVLHEALGRQTDPEIRDLIGEVLQSS